MDVIGDFLVRLKNAASVKKLSVSVPYSVLKHAIAEKLKETGYVSAIEKKGKKVRKTLDVALKYDETGHAIITNVRRISKPGRRVYRSAGEIVPVRYGRGNLILSTQKGILTGKEARKENVGGEALFEIW